MNFKTLQLETQNSIATLKINRPKALNALNSQVLNELNQACELIEKDENIKVLILTGEGKAFVAGADIAEMINKTTAEGAEFSKLGQDVFARIENLKIPVIAAINGFALGGGLELAMAADFRFASENAKMGQPEVNLGLIPGFAGTRRLARIVGLADALYLITTTEMIDANEALRLNLVQKVFSTDTLMEETIKIAETILSKGPNAVKRAKKVTRQAYNLPFGEAMKLEAEEFGNCFDKQGKEGMTAFLEKRKPNFQNIQ